MTVNDNFSHLAINDTYEVARTPAGSYYLVRRIQQEGWERLERVARLDRDVAVQTKRMLDRRLAMQARQNFAQMAKNPSKLVRSARGAELVKLFNRADEKTQLRLVAKNPKLIQFLANPRESVLLAAVRAQPRAIGYIKNPTEKVQLAAVSRDGLAIQLINPKSRTEKVRLAAVSQNGMALRYIGNPSAEIVRVAVQNTPEAKQFAKAPALKRDDFELAR